MKVGGEFHPLAELCRALARNFASKRFLEVGAGYGTVSVAVRQAQLNHSTGDSFVVAIEPDENLASWVEKNAKAASVDVNVVKDYSPACLTGIGKRFGSFDFILLDQEKKGMFREEFEALLPFLSRPCVVVAHDIARGHGGTLFWEYFKSREDVEFFSIPNLPGTGVGVLR